MHDTYFVVGHFHYVLSIGALFAVFAAWYYWIGKMCGRQYLEWVGQLHFWLTFLGVNMIFLPQHFLGLAGMPRRIPDYPDAYEGWNAISSYGAYITGIATLIFMVGVFHTLFAGRKIGDNPWGEGATTLEWQLSSPPPFHQFEKQPIIK